MKTLIRLLLIALFITTTSCLRKNDHITVVSISSLNGNIFPREINGTQYGGLGLISTLTSELSRKNEIEIIANSNFIYGTKEAYFTNGSAVIDLMNELEFSCLVVGHREFYYGFERLRELSEKSNFPFISSNLVYKDSSSVEFFEPYLIMKDNKSAVIGISTEKVLKANLEKDAGHLILLDPAGVVTEKISKLRSRGISRIIVAGDFDCDESSVSNLTPDQIRRLFAVEGVDLFLSTADNKYCVQQKTRPVIPCGINGFEAVSFKISDRGVSSTKKHKVNSELLDPDPGLSGKMADINNMIFAVAGTILGNAKNDIPHSTGQKFMTETPLGNLICDIMRKYTRTDIFIMNSGKVRKGFKKGPVSLGDLYNILPYEGNLVTAEMTGKEIKKILESSCAFKMDKSFLQVSGLSFSYDSSRKPFDRIEINGIRVNGRTIGMDTVYSVSMTDYIHQGGDSYNEFSDMGIEAVKVHQKQMREILRDHITGSGEIAAPALGRIKDISKL